MSDSQAGPSRERDRPRPTSAPYLNASSSQRQATNKLECASCRQTLPRYEFTEPQLKKLRQSNSGNSQPTCKACTPQQQSNLKCHQCGIIKSKAHFSKRQADMASEATCSECLRKSNEDNSRVRVDIDPFDVDYEGEEEEEDEKDENASKKAAKRRPDPDSEEDEEDALWNELERKANT